MGVWQVILPEWDRNMVVNPVAGAAGNFTDIGFITTTRPTTPTYLGCNCWKFAITANLSGGYFTLSALANAIHYTTLRIHSSSVLVSELSLSLDNANFTAPTLLSTEGDWWVYGLLFPAAQATGSTKLYIQQTGATNMTLYVGHVQVEQRSYPSTPITGNRKGFTPTGYSWDGAAHASSSIRSAMERSGGTPKDLESDYNFRVRYGQGTGMPPITHHTQGMALLPGALYQGHKVEPRVLDLMSATKANTVATVAAARKNFINAVKPDRVSPEQPVVFRYSGVNAYKPVDFYAYYDSGMEFQLSSGIVDQPVARFICYDPFAYETHTESVTLIDDLDVADADYVVRKINGTWYNISTNFDGIVRALTKGVDGCIYIGGDFTIDAPANGHYAIKWDPSTGALTALGTGMQDYVNVLRTAPNGDVYAGGIFTDAGGVAETDFIAYWDISAGVWASLTNVHPNDDVLDIQFAPNGDIYVCGYFDTLGGDANKTSVVKWVPGTGWVALGSGCNATGCEAMAIAQNGDVYVTGGFALAGGVANTAKIAYWDISASVWVPLGTGLNGTGYAIAIDKAGNVYVTGNFTTADGVACNYIAKWNGKTFEPLGTGLNAAGYTLSFDDNGLLYVGGFFTEAGGIALSDHMAIWNGTTWAHLDIDLPGVATPVDVLPIKKDIYIGYSTGGIALTSYLNTVTNTGSSSAYPVIKLARGTDAGISILEWIKNETTGDTLWCNYTMSGGETLTIDLTPGDRSIKSDFFGDVWRAVLRSSDLSSFRLLPGENKISIFSNRTGEPTLIFTMEWPITHWGADQVAV